MRIFLLFLFFNFSILSSFGQFSSFPIVLSLPFDGDTIESLTPTFVWQCNLSLIQSDPRLSLQYSLVELENGQSASEAILINQPLSLMRGLESSSYSYPSTLEALQKGHTYVWQIQLLYNDQIVQVSEPWKFTISDPRLPGGQYILLRRQPDGSRYVLSEPVLRLKVRNDGHFLGKNAVVRDGSNKLYKVVLTEIIREGNEGSTSVSSLGTLYYLCDMKSLGLKKGSYVFEWRSDRGEPYYLNFELK